MGFSADRAMQVLQAVAKGVDSLSRVSQPQPKETGPPLTDLRSEPQPSLSPRPYPEPDVTRTHDDDAPLAALLVPLALCCSVVHRCCCPHCAC